MAIAGRLSFFNLPELFSSTTRAKLGSCCLVATLTLSFWSTIQGWFQAYNLGFNYQGFLVLPLISILILRKNSALKRASVNSSSAGLLLLMAAAILWMFAVIAELKFLAAFSLITMLVASIFAMYGKKITGLLALPLFSLYFLIPAGQELFIILQEAIAWFLVHVTMLLDSAVYWQNASIIFAKHVYALDHLLAGLHFVPLFMLFGVGLAAFRCKQFHRQLLIISLFACLPMVFLSIGILALMICSKILTVVKLSLDQQTIFGWILTSFGLITALFLSLKMRAQSLSSDIDWHDSLKHNSSWFFATIFSACILLLTPIAANALNRYYHFSTTHTTATPSLVRNWNEPEITPNPQAGITQVSYTQNSRQINFSIARIMQPQTWDITYNAPHVKQSALDISIYNRKIPFTETIIYQAKHSKIIWNVYQINKHLVSNPILVKLMISFYSLTPKGADVELITVSTYISGDINAGRALLKVFVQDAYESHSSSWLN